MRIAYLDCFSGISGDMLLGALVHAGVSADALREGLAGLGLDEFRLEAQREWRDAMEGVKVDVVIDPALELPHRRLADVRAIVEAAALTPSQRRRAIAVFERLAAAEGAVHGCGPEEVHFHEVGATDAIVDVVGAVLALDLLGIEEVLVSPLALGSGFATCAHGKMPVPVPATVKLLEGFPVALSGLKGELVTPTGAALVATLAEPAPPGLSFVPRGVGYGFGTRLREGGPPNALRVVLGDRADGVERLVLLETNVDDATGQELGHLLERCLAEGALDAWLAPIQMKKNRPGTLVSVLADEARADALEDLLYRATPTLGVRRRAASRRRLARRERVADTPFGAIRVKEADTPAGRRVAPEHDDVARVAERLGVPLREARRRIEAALDAEDREARGNG